MQIFSSISLHYACWDMGTWGVNNTIVTRTHIAILEERDEVTECDRLVELMANLHK